MTYLRKSKYKTQPTVKQVRNKFKKRFCLFLDQIDTSELVFEKNKPVGLLGWFKQVFNNWKA